MISMETVETEASATGDIKETNAAGNTADDDVCFEFIASYTLKTMRLKYDKWIKMMAIDEYRLIMNEWRWNPQQQTLIISLTAIGGLWPILRFPLSGRGKHCYFIKKDSCINIEDINLSLIYGDISSQMLDCLSVTLESIYFPLFANKLNQMTWPDLVKDDISQRFHELRECVSVVKGKIQNETILPMPFNTDEIVGIGEDILDGKRPCDLQMQNILEGIVIKWSYLVNDIVTDSSSKLFNNGASPLPIAEVQFWHTQYQNLHNVYKQLVEDKRKMVGLILGKIDSVYYSAFRQTFQRTVAALVRARDNSLYLNPLSEHFLAFEKINFHECNALIEPMLHCFCLMWAQSKYYSNHWIDMFRMVGNLLIQESSKNLDAETMFQVDVEDVLLKLNETLQVFEYYRESMALYKINLHTFRTATTYAAPWNFRLKDVFGRIDEYINRLQNIKAIFQAAYDFFKLEKVEFGGVNGRNLNRRKLTTLNDYQMLFNAWSSIEFDPLHGSNKEFHRVRSNYQKKAKSLERKLAKIIDEAFDGCYTAEHCVQLLEIISTLAYRPIIFKQIAHRFNQVFDYYNENVDIVMEYFEHSVKILKESGLREMQTVRGLPPVAGALQWFWALRMRIENITKNMEYLDFTIFRTPEGQSILSRKSDFISQVNRIEAEIHGKWCDDVVNDIHTNMMKYLLIRTENNELCTNFDDKLILALKECQILIRMGFSNLPQCALNLFDESDSLWNVRVSLTRIAERYNFIRNKTEKCEYDLISSQIEDIDADLKILTDEYTWIEYDRIHITKIFDKISHLFNRLIRTQENIRNILDSINIWGNIPLYKRNKMHPKCLLDIANRNDKCKLRSMEAINSKALINFTMDENYRLFFDLPSLQPPQQLPDKNRLRKTILRQLDRHAVKQKNNTQPTPIEALNTINDKQNTIGLDSDPSPDIVRTDDSVRLYRPYEEYVDGLVANALMNAIKISLLYIFKAIQTPQLLDNQFALFEIKLDLVGGALAFSPILEDGAENGLFALIDDLIQDIYSAADLIPKIACSSADKHQTFHNDVVANADIMAIRSDIINIVRETAAQAVACMKKFQRYDYIWLENRDTYLKRFLECNENENADSENESSENNEVFNQLNLRKFRQQIDRWLETFEEVDKLESYCIFGNWLGVNLESFKQFLLNQCCKWGNIFKDHLLNYVQFNLNTLEAFIANSNRILATQIDRDDINSLLDVMFVLNEINERHSHVQDSFDPLRKIVDLLLMYSVVMPQKCSFQFSELPEKWITLRKTAANVTQEITPIKNYQADVIIKRITLHTYQVNAFQESFQKLAFFDVPCANVYDLCDETHAELTTLEDQYDQLKNSADLFILNMPSNQKLVKCRNHLKLIKQLWDFVLIIESCVSTWKKSPWKKLDVEEIEQHCKKFSKDIRILNKLVRTWAPFIYIERLLKNLVTSLRAITELQNTAIRDRHWLELMKVTGLFAKFGMMYLLNIRLNKKTTLSDLLNLGLHEHEEEVKSTVEKAIKEMLMEKAINDISTVWANMNLEFEMHERSGLRLIRASESLIELLEENQVQLQNMATSKHMAFFENDIKMWLNKLSNADYIIMTWTEVQRKWTYLESIFLGSGDIREQLPNDVVRFDRTHGAFKHTLDDINADLNVMRVSSHDSLVETMESILADLILCEKALNEYLETKRLAYPRFYFISSTDLLDILSNGNDPILVGKHLTKLYDSIKRLHYENDNHIALGMRSKEHDEYVPFLANCPCSGSVEVWLNKVTEAMRFTLHQLFSQSVVAYDEKAREVWVFDWPAQVTLCITQIWWSIEVNECFLKIDEGYENSLKDYQRKQISQLNALIILLLGDLNSGDRQKIMTICTVDVHSRDVVAKMIGQKVVNASAFQWQSQLRHRWDRTENDCFVNICDAQFKYDYEYLGVTPRLVITPLTDRCYITLTQSLHLIYGGAPAGPAGTGKTETTKDLGKGLGIMVYVFNCSEQMDYKSCGQIYKGLAASGAFGIFDEFNRISIEVLSVVAVQVKCIQDAIKNKRSTFVFMGEMISLTPTVGIFVTMNPGYAGRTELPENLKALFRPCAMVVPDFALICEIMLVAEGFQEARLLARKFITLYTLCRELLSKQSHYDWGLRAIKSVLVVAGALRRGDRQRPEDQVLMRALRDFNIPKIISDDMPVFMSLIGDLFPLLNVPRKRCLEFERSIKKTAAELKLQAEDGFVLKVVQMEELLNVRHSVFIVGNAGVGKSEVWKTLVATYINLGKRPNLSDLNPKSVTNNELFGFINPATREWKDGLLSSLMRDQANISADNPKWIVLDGDIDPMWIESLNTLMDDNKVLTLASNERIALTTEMRLIFEVGNLHFATPATVSRAGILYINSSDLGWYPIVASWIERRDVPSETYDMTILFDRYIPLLLEANKNWQRITPITEVAMLEMTCHLLDCLLTPDNLPPKCPREWYEIYFVFAVIWGFGSSLYNDQQIDWRMEFSKFWVNEFQTIKFPENGCVFDYYVEPKTKQFRHWNELIMKYDLDMEIPLQSTLVPTSSTVCLKWFLDTLIEHKIPVMLVGNAGSGKTVIVSDQISSLPENYAVTNIPFNYYTTAEMLQQVLEKPLEKKAGRNYGPPGSKFMIYFIDDMNMPEVDTFGTVSPHQIVRQYMDYRHWYDRSKLTLREIHNCQFAVCMNPTAGSFCIDARLQRHFCAFAVSFPSNESLYRIYSTILQQHLDSDWARFDNQHKKIAGPIVEMGLTLHNRVSQLFLPTALKFHYNFNLRDLANIYQGLLFATRDTCPEGYELVRLYIHEASRVYSDKLADDQDIDSFKKLFREVFKKSMEDLDDVKMFKDPIVYCHFADGLNEPKYMPVRSWEALSKVLAEAQFGYNEIIGQMNLVLFEDAMTHVCRINRILEGPSGNALLIGVGGSGKQSLARLSAFISSLSINQIQLRRGYNMADLKSDLNLLYMKVGVKNIMSMFLITDAQVVDESFLVLINDMLASGEVPDLFSDEEIDGVVNAVKNEVKQLGMIDTRDNCWKYFVSKVRKMLKIVLCFSPVGSTLRRRARKFPALINCTAINWFHEWPRAALESVSKKFLSTLKVLPQDLTESVSVFMAYVLGSVNDISQAYLRNEKRYNYTTPKSFLELIELYSKLLTEKTADNLQRINRLDNGLVRLAQCAEQVDSLKYVLAEQEINLKMKNEAAEKMILIVSAENEIVQKEKLFAAEEEKKVRTIEEDVGIKAKICEADLRRAEPSLVAAQEALNTLNKNNLTELRSFGTPPKAVTNVCAAVLVLFSDKGRIPKDRSWKACKQMMGAVDKFLFKLVNFDKENIPPKVIKTLETYLNDPEFDPHKILAKSTAASGLCAWVINIHNFYNVYLIVQPKQKALVDAKNELKEARDKMNFLNNKIKEIERRLLAIQAEFQNAINEKQKLQAEADKTALTINLAHRLVNGLGSEAIRWHQSVEKLKYQIEKLPGDVLLMACFISYVGSFTHQYRVELQENIWKSAFRELKPEIPHTEGVDTLELLCDDAQIATWHNEGLPNDRMSTENAIILTNASRWPLMIDPQLQGIKWIKQKYGKDLVVVRLNQKSYLDYIEKAVICGSTVLIENIDDSIDAVLDALLSRAFIKKSSAIKIGDREVDYNPNFRLILQTKLANPHYKPEMQAQTTLINFSVTRDGLEQQLLAEVVKAERPDLETLKSNLTTQQNHFKITLKHLEDDLLVRLASAGENVLADPTLVHNLEQTKKTAAEIENKVVEARATAKEIDKARENYRMVAERASILYFILNDLHRINPMYQFSLKAFIVVFKRAIASTVEQVELCDRVESLIDSVTYAVHLYTCRGLFEKDKLTYKTQMVLQILLHAKKISTIELDFLLRSPYIPTAQSPLDFLSNTMWGGIKTLCGIDAFRGLDKEMELKPKRWRAYIESESPEKERLPGEWKNKTTMQRLCILRTLRPDRMTYAASCFVEEIMGKKYVQSRAIPFAESFKESTASTPMFFILSPGVDPMIDVERLGKSLGYSIEHGNMHVVSLGQGQEAIAEAALELATQNGHWLVLQNIHLVAKWLPSLEKKIEETLDTASESFRFFFSAEAVEYHIIPNHIIEMSIKLTNENPSGIQANLHTALDNFSQETMEICSKESEFKSILFSLCYFHAVVAERRKFGSQGWNVVYPFNIGDLTISAYVLYNYLESNKGVPWEDLRYLFGEIMYGGHIIDDWDRRLCRTYLEEMMQPELVDGDLLLCAGFKAPTNTDYAGYHQYISDHLPSESPNLYGMHPNAEIGFLTSQSEAMFKVIFDLQPRDSGSSSGVSVSREETVKLLLEEILDKIPDFFNVDELMTRVEERTPFVVVAFQEVERSNILFAEMKRSLKELILGLKGELTITTEMELLDECLLYDRVPSVWTKLAFPSMMGLQSWFANLLARYRELSNWTIDFNLPVTVWLSGFFNPQSFLTAIMQITARKNEWPLDKMCLNVEVTGKGKEDFLIAPREGANIHGLFIEGARWDMTMNSIVPSRLKELFPTLPILYVKAITQDKQEKRNIYECPVYRTRQRGSTYVWTFNLRTREKASKWILAGVAILLQT